MYVVGIVIIVLVAINCRVYTIIRVTFEAIFVLSILLITRICDDLRYFGDVSDTMVSRNSVARQNLITLFIRQVIKMA